MRDSKNVVVIGSGFSSLSAACYLAKSGMKVTILEKNTQFGGRARQLKKNGYTFDIGPTFYWMPDVFESFFNDFEKKTSEYYDLERLDPAYEVYFGQDKSIKIGDSYEKIRDTFEEIEEGSGGKLDQFIANAKENYKIAIKKLVYQPGESIFEIINWKTIKKLGLFFSTIKKQVRSKLKNQELIKILEFPVLFLGAKPSTTPAFYNFMNYADFVLGTWHPKGGMYKVVEAMVALAKELGVKLEKDHAVERINVEKGKVTSVVSNGNTIPCDILLSGADYYHTESLLNSSFRQYSDNYWNKKTFAPSALLFYVGFERKLENISHHTLFFDTDFEDHAATIYDSKKWPSAPLFYASFPSVTDELSAPEGKEAGIFLVPLAPGLEDTPEIRDKYFEIILERLAINTKQEVKKWVEFKESYCVSDFIKDYNSYKGNAYGLANTLFQTHILRPKLKSKKVSNLYFTGQLTVPGPGVPPSIISGKIVSKLIEKYEI